MDSYYDRFTEPARRAMSYAAEEARRFRANRISPEHILLGITHEHDNAAMSVLVRIGISPGRIRSEIEDHISSPIGDGDPEFKHTERAEHVFLLAFLEARRMYDLSIHTDHLLLGLIREDDGLASFVLHSLGLELELARRKVEEFRISLENEEGEGPSGAIRERSRFQYPHPADRTIAEEIASLLDEISESQKKVERKINQVLEGEEGRRKGRKKDAGEET